MTDSDFNWEALIDRYIDVSNKRDLDGFFDLVHPGVAYFDAFWRETCVGRDLRQYMEDWYAIDTFEYRRLGEIITTRDGAVFRYSALDVNTDVVAEAMYTGAEVLTVESGKILTISDYYCDPTPDAMAELIAASAMRHGQSRYATAGYSQARLSKLQRRVVALIEDEDLHLDAGLTVHELAERAGCTPGHLIALAGGQGKPENADSSSELLTRPAAQMIAAIKDQALDS